MNFVILAQTLKTLDYITVCDVLPAVGCVTKVAYIVDDVCDIKNYIGMYKEVEFSLHVLPYSGYVLIAPNKKTNSHLYGCIIRLDDCNLNKYIGMLSIRLDYDINEVVSFVINAYHKHGVHSITPVMYKHTCSTFFNNAVSQAGIKYNAEDVKELMQDFKSTELVLDTGYDTVDFNTDECSEDEAFTTLMHRRGLYCFKSAGDSLYNMCKTELSSKCSRCGVCNVNSTDDKESVIRIW